MQLKELSFALVLTHWNEGNLYSDLNPKYNDIWGYTDIEGNEFAAIGTWDGTHIVDLQSNQETGFIPGSFSSHRDIKSFGNYIYIGTEANWSDPFSSEYSIESQGIQVVDMSDPFNPLLVNEWDGVVNSHNIMEHQGYLYVIGSTRETGSDGGESWGLDDLIVGSPESDPNGVLSGASFVVFGKTDGAAVELSTIEANPDDTPAAGFMINGVAADDSSGRSSVSNAGDVNGDGLDDLIIGAIGDDPNDERSGASFVVYGKTSGDVVELSDIQKSNGGFVINGVGEDDSSGWSVSGAGDVNEARRWLRHIAELRVGTQS